ncbi:MFS transporter [Acinetobacter shaoyimingii]|uniref:MFS transporter n=1 Tax=Acinetobacter shaoyimingii TaxID=2715164 RepID=A0A6G8RYN4_9GAMM|nr:MFS transporter [Acinetobacter shaoyimingii]QIO06981.1 MFS transporter [Acinetobacter shaoyimingii]
MRTLPNYIYFLLIGQGINLITAVLSVTVAAIVGLSLAPESSYATIPYGLQFFAILISTIIFSNLMKKFGRYFVFIIGIFFLFASGISGFLAITQSQFVLLCLSHFLLGLFISTANFYRFAATDGLASELIPKATSMVISGGVIAAIIAPLLAIKFEKIGQYPHYSFIYLILSALSIILFFVIYLWHKSSSQNRLQVDTEKPKSVSISYTPETRKIILIGIIGGALGYYLMNLMMIVSSLHLKVNHSFHYASFAIQLHVLAMFLPSFIVPKLIKHIGSVRIITLGFLLISLSSLLPIIFDRSVFINISLIILGIGWNFAYSGGSTLIGSLQSEDRIKIQGLSETAVAFFATLGAFLPAPILNHFGWINTNLISMIMSLSIVIIIFLLIYYYERRNHEIH